MFDHFTTLCMKGLKAPPFLLETTVRRSAVDGEDQKPHWKSEKRLHFLLII